MTYAITGLATFGALVLLWLLVILGATWRQCAVDAQVEARMNRATDAQLRAEVDLQFRELVAREWPIRKDMS